MVDRSDMEIWIDHLEIALKRAGVKRVPFQSWENVTVEMENKLFQVINTKFKGWKPYHFQQFYCFINFLEKSLI